MKYDITRAYEAREYFRQEQERINLKEKQAAEIAGVWSNGEPY